MWPGTTLLSDEKQVNRQALKIPVFPLCMSVVKTDSQGKRQRHVIAGPMYHMLIFKALSWNLQFCTETLFDLKCNKNTVDYE